MIYNSFFTEKQTFIITFNHNKRLYLRLTIPHVYFYNPKRVIHTFNLLISSTLNY